LLQEQDYIAIQLRALNPLFASLALAKRNGVWSFRHKSWFEYFMVRRLVQALEHPDSSEVLRVLSDRAWTSERSALLFAREALLQHQVEMRPHTSGITLPWRQKLVAAIQASRGHPEHAQTASNAITILNTSGASFAGLNFEGVHIP